VKPTETRPSLSSAQRTTMVIENLVVREPMPRKATACFTASMLGVLVLVLSTSCSDRYPFLAGDRCAPCECNDQNVVTSCKLAAEIGVLAVLDLRDKGITGIAPGAFDGLSSVNSLLLQHNSISNLTEAIQGAQQAYTIFLDNNNLEEIEPTTFQNMPKLRAVWVTGNGRNVTCDALTAADGALGQLKPNPNLKGGKVLCVDRESCRVSMFNLYYGSLGKGMCHGGAYNTPECAWDAGSCLDHSPLASVNWERQLFGET